jgi:hypothetical protein
VFLIISELPVFKSYFSRHWPLLSSESGLVCLGASMAILGVTILGNFNKQGISPDSLGLPFWRIVISSGVLVSVLGVSNIIAVGYAPYCNGLTRSIHSRILRVTFFGIKGPVSLLGRFDLMVLWQQRQEQPSVLTIAQENHTIMSSCTTAEVQVLQKTADS